jgi:lysophospholipase L1-like esterase
MLRLLLAIAVLCTPAATPARAAVVLAAGDSITAGCCASPNYFSVMAADLAVVGGFSPIKEGCAGASTEDWIGTDDHVAASCGTTIPESLYLSRIAPQPVLDIVTILLGTNDAGEDISPDDYEANLRTLVALVQGQGVPRIILVIPPQLFSSSPADQDRVQQYGFRVFAICADTAGVECGPNLFILLGEEDFAEDEIHPNAAGHAKIGHAVAQHILAPAPAGVPTMGPAGWLGLVASICATSLTFGRRLRKKAATAAMPSS